MRFFQVLNFYPSYLDHFYQARPQLEGAGYHDQVAALVADGFGACHTFAPHIARFGYETFMSIGNNHRSQLQWLKENGLPLTDRQQWNLEIVRRQIEWFKPEVLYVTDPVAFEGRFLKSLGHKPALIVGFIGSPIPQGIDWSDFDVILSNSTLCLELAKAAGAKAASWFWPGVPSFIIDAVKDEPKKFDVAFPGSWTEGHPRRNGLVHAIAQGAADGGAFTPAFFLNAHAPVPEVVARYSQNALWGTEMYRALKRARIVFNAELDFAGNEAGNMRAFETTAVGSFLLTEHHANMGEYFEPGVEIETFKSTGELLEKIDYYLANPDKREEIARRGQQRCIRDHVMDRRLEELDGMIRSALAPAGSAKRVKAEEDLYDKAYKWGWSQEGLRELVYLCYKTPNLEENARRFYESDEFCEAVERIGQLGFPAGSGARVLDIGCGNGVGSYALARSGYQVVGIDSSCGELAGVGAARKLIGVDGVRFEAKLAGEDRLDFPDASFDVIWMREVLHHIKELVPFLKEVKRVLKPGGILCCFRDSVIWNEEQRKNFFRDHPFYHITHDEGCFYLHEYRDAFKGAGLELEVELTPVQSVINTYPGAPVPGATFNQTLAATRTTGNDLFSFFVRKPAATEAGLGAHAAMERFEALQRQKEERMRASRPIEPPAPPRPAPFEIPPPPAASAATLEADPELLRRYPGVAFGAMIQVLGMGNITIGEGSCIGDCSWLNVCIRDSHVRMKIGRTVLVGRQGVISTGGTLEIGDFCTFAPRVYISDADHIFADPFQPVIQQGVTLNRSVIIEENVWLGINTVVAGNLTVGRGSVIGANAVVTRDIPPFSVAVGNPAQIVKMFSPAARDWVRTRTAEDVQRVLEERKQYAMPTREQYREILHRNAGLTKLEPVLAGRGHLP